MLHVTLTTTLIKENYQNKKNSDIYKCLKEQYTRENKCMGFM